MNTDAVGRHKAYKSLTVVRLRGFYSMEAHLEKDETRVNLLPGSAWWFCSRYGMNYSAVGHFDHGWEFKRGIINYVDTDSITREFELLLNTDEVPDISLAARMSNYSLVAQQTVAQPMLFGGDHGDKQVIMKHPHGWVVDDF